MSDTGLYSGIYSKIRDLANLVDNFLITAKSDPKSVPASERQQLSDALSAPDTGIVSSYFAIVLRDSQSNVDTKAIGKRLASGQIDNDVITQLEQLAMSLETERTRMLAKMRGR